MAQALKITGVPITPIVLPQADSLQLLALALLPATKPQTTSWK
jgi:hypothetical protein